MIEVNDEMPLYRVLEDLRLHVTLAGDPLMVPSEEGVPTMERMGYLGLMKYVSTDANGHRSWTIHTSTELERICDDVKWWLDVLTECLDDALNKGY